MRKHKPTARRDARVRTLAALALLVLLLAVPTGLGNIKQQGAPQPNYALQYQPQMYCVIVADTPGRDTCLLEAQTIFIQTYRIRAENARVDVYVTDQSRLGVVILDVKCFPNVLTGIAECTYVYPSPYPDAYLRMLVDVYPTAVAGKAAAFASVRAEGWNAGAGLP